MTSNPLPRLGAVLPLTLVALVAGVSSAPAQSSPPLVTVEQALRATDPVQVAVTVERGSVVDRQVDGAAGAAFTVTGPAGERVEVELIGKVPPTSRFHRW